MQWILWVNLYIFGLWFGLLPTYSISITSSDFQMDHELNQSLKFIKFIFKKCLELGGPLQSGPLDFCPVSTLPTLLLLR